ncbi:MAG TPA: hypothetical protein VFP14_01810, partial [Novosphingobium sp.]|nr:hypothetical protein [Novosphingobium sp.]
MATITGTNGNDSLIGTTGADNFSPLLGRDTVAGGAGFDLLTIDYSTLLGVTGTVAAGGAGTFSGLIGNSILPAANSVTFSGVEALALTLSSGNDSLTIDAAPLNAGATLLLNGGVGFDLLRIDFSTLADTTFQQAANFLVTSNRGTFSGWDQFDITLGPGSNIVTTQLGADIIRTTGGNDTISTGAGNDTIWSAGSIDVINGGAGMDLWNGDYSAWSSTLGFSYDTSTGQGYVTNGTTLTGIEGGSIVTGSADDSFLLKGLGTFRVDGGGGDDWLTWDDTGDLGLPYSASFENGGGATFAGSVANATFAGMEHINAALGDGSNYAYVDAVPLVQGATINLSGGLGFDTLAVDFSALAGTSFLVAADGSIAANRGTWADFEQFLIAVGAGANSVVTGTGDDAIWSAGGQDTVDGGAGYDQWQGDYSPVADPLDFVWNGATGSGTLSNGTRLTNIEYVDLKTGSGDDQFVLSGPAITYVHASGGVDSLVRNDAGLLGLRPDVFIMADGSAFQGFVGLSWFDGVERVSLTLSNDDNAVYVDAGPTATGATIAIDGGVGTDTLMLDLASTPGASVVVDAAGVLSGNRSTYAGFEAVWIGLGSGSNAVTTGAGNDTVEAGTGGGSNLIATGAGDDLISGGSGAETVDGGAGFDVFAVSGFKADHALTRDGFGGYILTQVASGTQDRLTAVEQVRFADGTSDLS